METTMIGLYRGIYPKPETAVCHHLDPVGCLGMWSGECRWIPRAHHLLGMDWRFLAFCSMTISGTDIIAILMIYFGYYYCFSYSHYKELDAFSMLPC